MTVPREQIQAARDQRDAFRLSDTLSALDDPKPITPREMVACMDQYIEYAAEHRKASVDVDLFELREWRDALAGRGS